MAVYDLQHTLDNPFHMYHLDNTLLQTALPILSLCYTNALMDIMVVIILLYILVHITAADQCPMPIPHVRVTEIS